MAQYIFDRVVINPPAELRHALIEQAAEAANRGARTRTVGASELPAGKSISTDEGAYWADGGGVPNSYRQRAETSVLGLAWWTDASGCKHVRIVSGRIDAPKSAFGRRSTKCFGLTEAEYDAVHCAALVYPCLRVPHPPKKDKGLIPEILRALEVDVFDRASWMALADQISDTNGHGVYSLTIERCREALAVLDGISPVATRR